jgi:hypothetical protein
MGSDGDGRFRRRRENVETGGYGHPGCGRDAEVSYNWPREGADGEMMMEIDVPGKVLAQAFQVDAIVIAECVLVSFFQFDDPFHEGFCRVIGVGMIGVVIIFPIGLAADA